MDLNNLLISTSNIKVRREGRTDEFIKNFIGMDLNNFAY